MKIFIGTSGWNYRHWKNKFYPKKLNQKSWLRYYSRFFNTVEINNSFYVLPKKKILKSWKKQVAESFTFSVKASRFITHVKRLRLVKTATKKFFYRVKGLKVNLGPVLFQLPPNLNLDFKLLYNFIYYLKNSINLQNYGAAFVVEFRNLSWYKDKVFKLLKSNDICMCIHDHKNGASPIISTADTLYFRFHGPEGTYSGKYLTQQLKKYSQIIKSFKKDSYVYFNNDYNANAVKNARELIKFFN